MLYTMHSALTKSTSGESDPVSSTVFEALHSNQALLFFAIQLQAVVNELSLFHRISVFFRLTYIYTVTNGHNTYI